MLERIDHIICVVPDLGGASESYERLGLRLTAEERHAQTGSANRACFVGNSSDSAAYLELLSVFDPVMANATGRSHYVEAMASGGGLVGLGFGVSEIEGATAELSSAGFPAPVLSLSREDGSKVCDVAWVETGDALPYRISLIQYPEPWEQRYDRSRDLGRFAHSFPVKRLDHLAAVAPDIESACRFWSEVLGVPVHGEIRTPQLIIRQLKIGDAILELLGPAGPESPMANRPASLASMAAWEVTGRLDDAVALARECGFSPSDPEAGVIPGTRRSTIPAAELGGIGMQLLEYV